MKRVAIITALVATTLTSLMVTYRLRFVFALLGLAIVLAASVRPLVAGIMRLRVPRLLALMSAYTFAVAGPVVVGMLLFPRLAGELSTVLDGFFSTYARRLTQWQDLGGRWAMLADWLPTSRALGGVLGHARPSALAGGAWWATRVALETAASGVLVLVLSLHWSLHGEQALSAVAAAIPARYRSAVRRCLTDLGMGVGRHVLGEALKSLAALTVVAMALAAAGSPAPAIAASLVALLRLVPLMGILFSMVVVGVAAAGFGPGVACAFAVGTVVLLVLLDRAMPRLLHGRDYNPLLVAFVALLLASVLGWLGLLLAPALAAAIQITGEAVVRARREAVSPPGSAAEIRERHEVLMTRLRASRRTSKKTLSVATSLGQLIADVEEQQQRVA